MMTYLPSILAALVGVATVFAPFVQAWVAMHPAWTGVIAAIGTIIAHFMPSPTNHS